MQKVKTPTKALISAGGMSLAIVMGLGLSGCASESEQTSTPKPSLTASQNTTSTKPSTTSPTPTATSFSLKSEPTDKSCDSILTLQSLYDFDPNLGTNPNTPGTLGRVGGQQMQLGGVSCTVINLSTQEETQVVVVKLDKESAAFQAAQMSAPPAGFTAYQVANNVPGIFSSASGIGTAEFMSGPYWVSLASPTFTGGVDASPLSYVVWKNLQ